MSDIKVITAICRTRKTPPRPPLYILSNDEGNKLWSLLESCWEYTPEKRPRTIDVWNDVSSHVSVTVLTCHDKRGVQIKATLPASLGPRLEVAENFLTGLTVCFPDPTCVLLTDSTNVSHGKISSHVLIPTAARSSVPI